MTGGVIDRAFLRTAEGLIHYRSAGVRSGQTPLVMAHGGPGSSLSLVPLIADLSEDRPVAAPDMMGNGESDPPPSRPTAIPFYAEGLLAVMDHLGLDVVDLYGHHTGAQVITEFAVAHPSRVRRLVLDGVGLFPADLRAEFLTRYAPEITPGRRGGRTSPGSGTLSARPPSISPTIGGTKRIGSRAGRRCRRPSSPTAPPRS